jgi:hypothetical protein
MAEPVVSLELELELRKINQQLGELKGRIQSEGKEAGDKFSKSFGGNLFGGLSKQIVALGVSIAGALSFREAIRGAIEAQNSISAFNRSLASTGQFTEQASASFQQYADSIENTSSVTADATLSAASLIQSIGKLDVTTLKPATQSALDLSAALGINLESAARLVGRAANGEVDSFKKFGLEIQKGATDAQTFTNALAAISAAFGGANASAAQTFSGQLTRLQNAFGGVLTELGKAIVDSPVIISLFRVLGDEFIKLKKSLEGLDLSSFFSVDGIIAFGAALNNFVVAPLELLVNGTKLVFDFIRAGIQTFVRDLGLVGLAFAKVVSLVSGTNKLTEGLTNFAISSQQVLDEFTAQANESANKIFDGTVFSGNQEFLENLRLNLEAAKALIEASDIKNQVQVTPVVNNDFLDNFIEGFKKAEITTANFAAKTKEFGSQIRANLIAGIANGAGQAFAAFGKALANGENGLKAFADSFITSIGQIAVQQGTAFILQGLAYTFIPGLGQNGVGLIAAGAALATLGGALSAFSGGGAGAGSATAANGGDTIGGQSIIDPRTGLAAPQERLEPQTAVQVTIQGDVFDSEETGLRIAGILRDSSLNNNVRATVFA